MDRKLQIRVLRNGPTKDSQEETDCAAWLIQNGLAGGAFIPDNTRSGGHAASVTWRGPTPLGEKAIAESNVISMVLNSKWVSGIAIGLIVGILLFFIPRLF